MTQTTPEHAKLDSKLRREVLIGRYVANPLVRGMFRLGLTPPLHTLIETRGRKSGLVRRVPVAYRLDGNQAWVISQHGRRSGWAANISADSHVRILHGRQWRDGVAEFMPDDDVRARIRTFSRSPVINRLVATMFEALETRPMTVRIDLTD